MISKNPLRIKNHLKTKSFLWNTQGLNRKTKLKIAKAYRSFQRRRRRISEYGHQLLAKRRLSAMYGSLSLKTLKKVKNRADDTRKFKRESFIRLLEGRLDTCLFRMNISPSFAEVRQFISHGFVRVNHKRVSWCGFSLKFGDLISLDPKLRRNLHKRLKFKLRTLQISLRRDSRYRFQQRRKRRQRLKDQLKFRNSNRYLNSKQKSKPGSKFSDKKQNASSKQKSIKKTKANIKRGRSGLKGKKKRMTSFSFQPFFSNQILKPRIYSEVKVKESNAQDRDQYSSSLGNILSNYQQKCQKDPNFISKSFCFPKQQRLEVKRDLDLQKQSLNQMKQKIQRLIDLEFQIARHIIRIFAYPDGRKLDFKTKQSKLYSSVKLEQSQSRSRLTLTLTSSSHPRHISNFYPSRKFSKKFHLVYLKLMSPKYREMLLKKTQRPKRFLFQKLSSNLWKFKSTNKYKRLRFQHWIQEFKKKRRRKRERNRKAKRGWLKKNFKRGAKGQRKPMKGFRRRFVPRESKKLFQKFKKPSHLEISYKLLTAIYLFPVQEIKVPIKLDVARAMRAIGIQH